MRKISIENELKLEINGQAQVLKFDIGAMRKLGIKRLEDIPKGTSAMLAAALCILNRAIVRYNGEYNGSEPPIVHSEFMELLETTDDIRRAETAVRMLYLLALPIKKEEFNVWQDDEEGRKIEPTVGRLAVMGLTVLGLTLAEVESMTAAELSEMLDDYGYINKPERKERATARNTDGIGDAGAVWAGAVNPSVNLQAN